MSRNHSTQPVSQNMGVIAAKATTWSGPIPDPASLAAYQKLVPDAPERILAMAEEEARSRREREDKDHESANLLREVDVKNYHEGIKRGQYMALVIILVCIASSIFCVMKSAYTVASILAGAGFAGIASQFIGRKTK